MTDQSRSRIDRVHEELPKHALLSIVLATILLFQVEILSQVGAVEKHMDVARVAGPAVAVYGLWPLISLAIDYGDKALYEHVITRYWKVDR